ncbi:hypothetical protein CBL_13576 [Carabus blaptoides fortunei]
MTVSVEPRNKKLLRMERRLKRELNGELRNRCVANVVRVYVSKSVVVRTTQISKQRQVKLSITALNIASITLTPSAIGIGVARPTIQRCVCVYGVREATLPINEAAAETASQSNSERSICVSTVT